MFPSNPAESLPNKLDDMINTITNVSVSSGAMEATFAEVIDDTKFEINDGKDNRVQVTFTDLQEYEEGNIPLEVDFAQPQQFEDPSIKKLLDLIDAGFHRAEGFGTRAYMTKDHYLFLEISKPTGNDDRIFGMKVTDLRV